MTYRWIILLTAFAALGGCKEDPAPSQFRSVQPAPAGIDFVNQLEDEPDFNIVEYLYFYNGGGVAIGDINNDGLPDICFTGNQKPNRLYLNLGDFKFQDITERAFNPELETWSTGVTMADINADGFLDIYISQVGEYKVYSGGRNLLYINNGDLTFSESATEYNLDFSGFSTQSAFFDYDLDGDLDMYLVNHAVHTPRSFTSADERENVDSLSGDRLYRNLLVEEGHLNFEDVTAHSGIYSSLLGYGLGVAIADVNGDSWPDVYVSNDFHENDYLYINQKDGTFTEEGQSRLAHMSRFSMGSDIADINGDNQLDIFTLDMLPADPKVLLQSGGEDSEDVYAIKVRQGYHHQYSRNTMQINQEGRFVDVALLTDTYATDWSWSVLIEDYDLDGTNDLYITNGIYRRPNDLDYINFLSNSASSELANLSEDDREQALIQKMPTMKLANYLFKNGGDTSFLNVAETWGLGEPSYSNGAAYGDLDNDGDLDLVVNNINAAPFIYDNQNLRGHKSLTVRLAGESGNTFGLGAKIKLFGDGKSQVKTMTTTRGFISSSEPIAVFGLGKSASIDSVIVDWGGGRQQTFTDLSVDTLNILRYERRPTTTIETGVTPSIRKIPFSHRENNYDDFDVEPLMPHRLSKLGPSLAVGDVNRDGLDDVFVGGGPGQAPGFFIQEADGTFEPISTILDQEFPYEDVAAHFFDADGDDDLDLVVLSGGNELTPRRFLYRHRIFENVGNGEFQRRNDWLPAISSNGSVVRSADYDLDGDLDLFLGSSSIPGMYGASPQSYLLENDGSGKFTDVTEQRAPLLSRIGMVTDAEWYDHQNDGDMDLVVVGLWMPVTLLVNGSDGFAYEKIADSEGWWNAVTIADMNADGRQDIVAGNLGLNSKLKASIDEPLTLYIGDFDGNGRSESLLFHYWNHESIPFHTRDEIASQLPQIKKRFLSYQDFAKVRSLQDLLPNVDLSKTTIKTCARLESSIFLQGDSSFSWRPLPKPFQITSINDLITLEKNDNELLVIGVGNFFDGNVLQGRYAATPLVMATIKEGAWIHHSMKPKPPQSLSFNHVRPVRSTSEDVAFVLTSNGGPVVILEEQIITSSR